MNKDLIERVKHYANPDIWNIEQTTNMNLNSITDITFGYPNTWTITPECSTKLRNTNMEKTMYTPEENKARNLTNWVYEIHNSKIDALQEKFNLNQIRPKNDEEIVEFIQKGQFTLEEHDDAWCGRKVKKLVWVDPNRAPDKAGYEAAKKVLDKDYTTTTRIIQIKTPDEGLTALTEFENKVY